MRGRDLLNHTNTYVPLGFCGDTPSMPYLKMPDNLTVVGNSYESYSRDQVISEFNFSNFTWTMLQEKSLTDEVWLRGE